MKKKHAGLILGVLATAGLVIIAHAAMAASAAANLAVPREPQASQQTAQTVSQRNMPPDFMGVAGITGWILSGNPRTFPKEGLYGYIDGGAEIFLQYGFRDLTVFDLVPDKAAAPRKAITLEIYRMGSPKAAFGIFSTRREGGEPVSPGIKTFHWLGQEQASFVKGDFYVNILASGCTQAEVGNFVASLAVNLPSGETPMPGAFSCLPEFNLVPGTERYICGDIAAANESPLLGADFWGFKGGQTEAYSAKYGPDLSKLIIINFKKAPPANIFEEVYGLFKEYHLDTTTMNNVMQGRTVVGRWFLFGQNGPNGIIILDAPDPEVARARLQEALDKTAKKMNENKKDKSDDKK
jgi:hypothetical protein